MIRGIVFLFNTDNQGKIYIYILRIQVISDLLFQLNIAEDIHDKLDYMLFDSEDGMEFIEISTIRPERARVKS